MFCRRVEYWGLKVFNLVELAESHPVLWWFYEFLRFGCLMISQNPYKIMVFASAMMLESKLASNVGPLGGSEISMGSTCQSCVFLFFLPKAAQLQGESNHNICVDSCCSLPNTPFTSQIYTLKLIFDGGKILLFHRCRQRVSFGPAICRWARLDALSARCVRKEGGPVWSWWYFRQVGWGQMSHE